MNRHRESSARPLQARWKWAATWFEGVGPDLQSAAAILRKSPGFSLAVVLMFALGLGTSIGFFSTLNDVFWRTPRGVQGADRLLVLRRSLDGKDEGFSPLGYLAYQRQTRSFAQLLAFRGATVVLRDGDAPVRLEAKLVTANFFSALGVGIARGRDFLPEEDRTPGTHPVAIISYRLWRQRFNSEPGLVGRTVRLDKTVFTIVGIAPAGFGSLEIELGGPPDLWLPLRMEGQGHADWTTLNGDSSPSLSVIGRLQPDVSRQQAEAELAVVTAQIEKLDEKTGRRPHVELYSHLWYYRPENRAEAVSILGLPNGIVGFVLLIVCANVANLFLARGTTRRKEIAVRQALGAGRWRIIRQLTGESLLLALIGGIPGLGVAWYVNRLFWKLWFPPMETAGLDHRIALYALTLTALVGLACGLGPAWLATRSDLPADLKAGAGQTTPTRSWLRTALVVAQVGAALVLLNGAGLFIRTLQKLSEVDFGFPVDNLLVVQTDLSTADYPAERAGAFHQQLTKRIAALPGVESVSRAVALPRRNNGLFWGTIPVVPEDGGQGSSDSGIAVERNEVAPDYFATLRVPLLRGREFTVRDSASAPRVVIVNETLARRLWPGEDPLGKRLRFGGMGLGPFHLVVGVARDLRTFFQEEKPPPQVYLALDQGQQTDAPLLVRLRGGEQTMAALLQNEQRQLDPGLPPATIKSLRTVLAEQRSGERNYALLFGLFGGVALVLVAFGLYSVLAYDMAQRTREIGVRMALGAQSGDVLRLVVREGLAVTAAGVGGGLAVNVGLLRILANQLYGVSPLDPVAAATSVVIVAGVSLLASWLPARHATQVDPLLALRAE
jgi:predicted permease